MPAAAVIPAPRAYINVVAVKKPVVGFEHDRLWQSVSCFASGRHRRLSAHIWRFAETCGIVHWLKGHSVDPEATSEGLHSIRCARSRHCE